MWPAVWKGKYYDFDSAQHSPDRSLLTLHTIQFAGWYVQFVRKFEFIYCHSSVPCRLLFHDWFLPFFDLRCFVFLGFFSRAFNGHFHAVSNSSDKHRIAIDMQWLHDSAHEHRIYRNSKSDNKIHSSFKWNWMKYTVPYCSTIRSMKTQDSNRDNNLCSDCVRTFQISNQNQRIKTQQIKYRFQAPYMYNVYSI